MKKLAKIVGAILGVVVALVAVVLVWGALLPRKHSATRSVVLHKPVAEVYQVVRDFSAAPSWRHDVQTVTVENSPGSPLHFREASKYGAVNYELVEDIPGERMVTRILDTDLGYAGQWTYVFSPESGGTRLTITEDGEVSKRTVSLYVEVCFWAHRKH
jgi:uncharacterized membrane protein